jgi:hypothetical protein
MFQRSGVVECTNGGVDVLAAFAGGFCRSPQPALGARLRVSHLPQYKQCTDRVAP